MKLKRQELKLNTLEIHYTETKNPLYIWEAVQYCIENKLSMPDYVLKYLKNTAKSLLSANIKKDYTNQLIKDAVGINGNLFQSYQMAEQQFRVCTMVKEFGGEIRGNTMPAIKKAKEALAKEGFDLKESSIKTYWNNRHKILPEFGETLQRQVITRKGGEIKEKVYIPKKKKRI